MQTCLLLFLFSYEAGGAWLVAHKAEQRRRFKAVLCAKPRTYSQIREERKRALKDGSHIVPPAPEAEEEEEKILDGFFLVSAFVNISLGHDAFFLAFAC